jgi:hypothetical protein
MLAALCSLPWVVRTISLLIIGEGVCCVGSEGYLHNSVLKLVQKSMQNLQA